MPPFHVLGPSTNAERFAERFAQGQKTTPLQARDPAMMATLEWMRARGTSTAQLAEAEAEVTAAAQATQVAADALANARAQVTLRHAELLTWTLHCVTREHMVEEHAKAEAGLQQAHAKQDEAQARMNRAALKLDRAA